MNEENQTTVTFFILKGISEVPELQTPVFILILFLYLTILGGNMTVLVLICMDPHLHNPMYFFLGNLSVMDMISVTVTLHKVLGNFISGDKTISISACMTQMYLYSSITDAEMLMLTAMSYDRYVAICNPLLYPVIMSNIACILLAFFSWLLGFIESLIFLLFLLNVSCYRSNIMDHFYCDPMPLMELSCSGTSTLERVAFIEGIPVILTPFSLTFTSYIYIISTILRIRSSTGKRKTFYTCSSHLTVFTLLYITIVFVYLTPTSSDRMVFKKISALCNTMAIPLLNPLIYSLKNKDMKSAFKRLLRCFNVAI
ncbi:olfactory receptor 6C1-like [Bombina bombina]|uniref:olfactory receptor 6C1-like n=1 Tax=Bombina bombina TaxID=8345 RepID=UPI00235A7163|nr:olfactory receptor 6C1-like [Bombina bombina]